VQMKSFLVPLVVVVTSTLTGAEQDVSPVSSWTFDGALTDAEGQAKDHLTVSGKKTSPRFVSPAELPGVKGKAIALGVKAHDALYLTAPASADVKLGPSYTIEAWIHPTQILAWNRLVLNWGRAHAYHFAIHNGVLSLYHGQADGKYLFAEGGPIHPGRWYHAVGVARRNEKNPTDSKLEVYLNGKRTASATYDGTIRTLANEGLGIGDAASGNGTAIRFRGYIDEVTIWNGVDVTSVCTRNPQNS